MTSDRDTLDSMVRRERLRLAGLAAVHGKPLADPSPFPRLRLRGPFFAPHHPYCECSTYLGQEEE